MAIIDPPLELTAVAGQGRATPIGAFSRPVEHAGWRSWLTTVDHKKIGIMYGAAAMFFFFIGGMEAILIRMQLAQPNGKVLSADLYNQLFTMHGTTMVFLVIMPLAAAFGNYLLPLQIGARDVAFPRLNAFGFWCFLAGGIFLNLSWFLGGGANGGWFMYAPNSGALYNPSHGIDFWGLGLQIAGIASLTGAVNLIVTVLNMRAPGMDLMKMPIFTWMILVIQFLLLFAVPVITVALFLLMFDRRFGAHFFDVAAGSDPLLWQHLFWIFGHPEVYILILPAFGIISEILPTFSRKPLFGYTVVVYSGIAIGFMGWGVWVHHMFVSGLGPWSVTAFSISTMLIAVPTGVKILNWLATMVGGNIRFATPMMFSVGAIAMFTLGGLSGVSHAVAPADTQQTDTYYIVAHFHYVIFGGGLFGMVGGMYYWWPKMFGKLLDEKLGKAHFWLMFLGFNLTFGPMHVVGLMGQPRRMYRYAPGMGFDIWNQIETVGSYIIFLAFVVFAVNIWKSRKSEPAPLDPWDARTLEWLTESPPAVHNFDRLPVVTHVDEFFYRKYAEDDHGGLVKVTDGESLVAAEKQGAVETGEIEHMHMPSPSYWPIVVSLALPVIAGGLIFSLWLCLVGGAILVTGIWGWALEDSVEPDPPGAADDHAEPELVPAGAAPGADHD